MRIEMHVHTKYSRDSLQLFLPLYIKCRVKKIDVVAITEHNNIYGGLAFRDYCEKHGNQIQVIVGEEIFTDSGEIIGLFLEKNIKSGLSVQETIDEIKRQNGLIYVPHPYDLKRNKTVLKEKYIAEFKDSIDCIEIHNGRNISVDYDIKQKEISDRYGIKPVIGSDAHTTIEIGRNYMECDIECDKSVMSAENFRMYIPKLQFHCRKCLMLAHEITVGVKFMKLFRKGESHELYRVIFKRVKKN